MEAPGSNLHVFFPNTCEWSATPGTFNQPVKLLGEAFPLVSSESTYPSFASYQEGINARLDRDLHGRDNKGEERIDSNRGATRRGEGGTEAVGGS